MRLEWKNSIFIWNFHLRTHFLNFMRHHLDITLWHRKVSSFWWTWSFEKKFVYKMGCVTKHSYWNFPWNISMFKLVFNFKGPNPLMVRALSQVKTKFCRRKIWFWKYFCLEGKWENSKIVFCTFSHLSVQFSLWSRQ